MLVFTELPHQSLWLHVVWSTTGRTACCSLVAWGPPAKGGNIGYYLKGFWFRCMGDCCISYSRDDPSPWQSTSGCAREWRPPLAGMQVGPCRWWRRCSPALEEQCHSCITMYKAFLSLSIELEGMCTDVCVLFLFFLNPLQQVRCSFTSCKILFTQLLFHRNSQRMSCYLLCLFLDSA